ncbi:MAG TPA: lamin tail domain-containing protein [Acidimicrobiales bacterium]|nr:lamin tail domain-containing protein [Acidimicrobiales bacterium]
MRSRVGIIVASVLLGIMGLPLVLATPASAAVPGQVVITEWMYNPVLSASEFVEVTNIGGTSVDMTGYSFDDDSRTPGTFPLASFGTLAPGESGLIVESTADAFRTEWGLDASVKVAGGNTANLGRADEINIFSGPNATDLADRLTYGDQTFAGTIRTQGKSGVPATCLGLGANNVGLWQLSAVGDGLGSKASVSGDIESPGTTPLGACGPVTIAGGNGTGNPNTLPCNPELPSGTGPAPANAQTWPGGSSVAVADNACAWKTTTGPEGRDMSGLVFDPANAGVLYAAKNKSWVFRLVRQGDLWVPDTTNSWGAGKQIFFPGGVGQPDSEGITVGGDGALYVTTERDNANNAFALNSILRFDPSVAGTTLTPTMQWDLTSEFPELIVPGGDKTKANLGFEGVAFVPDTYLVQNGFVDQSTGSAYYPGDYPLHGTGLFFAALENDGKLYAYALNSDGTFHRVATVDTGMGHVMDVQYDADLERIWALCDNTCAVSSTLMKVDATGTIVPDVVYARPSGLPDVNIEGFAIAPASTCANGFRQTVWSDDGIAGPGHEGHALYTGTFPCGLDLGAQGAPPAADLGDLGPGDVNVPQNAPLAIRASGFVPGETVQVELHSKPLVLASVVADQFGFAIANVTIPFYVPTGAHEIWLVAPSTTVKAPLTVTPEVVPDMNISDASIAEGNSGLRQLTFTVTLSFPAPRPVVGLTATKAGTATPIVDYLPDIDVVKFAPGETSKTVTVWIVGDKKKEADETFNVRLVGNLGPANIADVTALGTILNDD